VLTLWQAMIADTLRSRCDVALAYHKPKITAKGKGSQEAKVQLSVSRSKANPSAVCHASPRDKSIAEIIVSGAVTDWFGTSS
jgi:hypothetical protein